MPVGALPNETARLRAAIQAPGHRLRFTRHAREEMAKDGIIEADARRVLRQGVVTWTEAKRDELWHVEGKDVDGKAIRLVVAVAEEGAVLIVTAMALRRRR